MTIAQYRRQTEKTRPGLEYSSSVAVVVTGREIIQRKFDRRESQGWRNEVFVYGRIRRGRGDRGERRVRERKGKGSEGKKVGVGMGFELRANKQK